MANRKKNNKNVIIGSICAVVVVVAIVIVAVVLATGGNKLNDNYFQSDGQKYVVTFETDQTTIAETGEEYIPVKTHLVYTYSGDSITGLKYYYEYADEATAKKALGELQAAAAGEEGFGEVTADGKYVIVAAPEDQYKDLTTADVKAQIEFMEQLKNANMNNQGTDSTNGEVVEENATVVEETQ